MSTWNDTVWSLRLLTAAGWTALCVVCGALWLGAIAANPVTEPAVRGGALVVAGACSGACWTLGLVPLVLVSALLRR